MLAAVKDAPSASPSLCEYILVSEYEEAAAPVAVLESLALTT
jgi:hypothetical protein